MRKLKKAASCLLADRDAAAGAARHGNSHHV